MSKLLKVNCPTCNKSIPWSEESSFRPFCSERCKMIDLGAWSNEEYSIPSEPAEEWSEHSVDKNQNSLTQTFH